jgi:transposase InsO family protein
MTDNGKEFTTHHEVSKSKHSFEIMLNKLNVKHIYTKVRRPQTNGKIERFWQIFEKEFFQKFQFNSWKDLNISMKDWLVYYNTKREH